MLGAILGRRAGSRPLRWLLLTGFGLGVLQFGFLYAGIAAGMPAGLASLVLQSSAPFTIILAVLFLGERLAARQLAGLALAAVSRTSWQVFRRLAPVRAAFTAFTCATSPAMARKVAA